MRPGQPEAAAEDVETLDIGLAFLITAGRQVEIIAQLEALAAAVDAVPVCLQAGQRDPPGVKFVGGEPEAAFGIEGGGGQLADDAFGRFPLAETQQEAAEKTALRHGGFSRFASRFEDSPL